ncbi:hypothetical protein OROMI_021126 [Orobanche minor]
MDNKDVIGLLKRDEFEEISIHILERAKKALLEAQFTIDSIHAVEVMGSGSRVPAVIKILTEFFGKEPRRILDSSECVVKGCGLECTPSFKVEELKVQVMFPFPIALTWQGSSHKGNVENQERAIVFPKGSPIPSVKALTFYTSGTFTVDVQYADVSELQAPLKINTYTIQATKGERAKVKMEAHLNLHGIVSVESAQLIEEEEEVPVKKEMDTDKAPADVASANETDVNTQETDAKVEKEAVVDVQKAVDKECEMMDEKETYVFEMRNKLCEEESDRISRLPGDLIVCILDRVPIEDAVRTSTLSKEWRYIWIEKKELVFDRSFFQRFLYSLGFPNLEYLHLGFAYFGDHEQSVMLLPQLKHLYLSYCTSQWNFNIIAPKLKHLRVPFSLDTWLLRLLDNSPCITVLRIRAGSPTGDITPLETRPLDIILSKLPMLEDLHVRATFFEELTIANIPKSLPAPFTGLKHLGFDGFDISNICHLQGMLFLLRSSPNLETLAFRGLQRVNLIGDSYYHHDDEDDEDDEDEGPATYALQALLNSTFTRLETVEMKFLKKGLTLELLFIQLLLANSPSLKKLTCMKSREFIDAHELRRIAKDVMHFPRASTNAKLLFLSRY